MKQKQLLSKTDYINYLKHPAWMWLYKHQKDRLPEIDISTQEVFDRGNTFEGYAEQLYPDGVKLESTDYHTWLDLHLRTKEAVEKGTKTILQGRFQTDKLSARPDIVERVDKNTYDLTEIKSATKVKEYYLHDLAFQVLVMEGVGYKIRDVHIIYVNKDYKRKGAIDVSKLTKKEKVTSKVRELIPFTKEHIQEALEILDKNTAPDLSPRYADVYNLDYKWYGYWYDIFMHLNPNLDPYSIYYLYGSNAELIGKLEDEDIEYIKDIPLDLVEKDKQKYQIKTTRSNKKIIKKKKIKKFLSAFKYPLYFLDYETFMDVIPPFDNLQPYKQYPFQYSLHILDKPDGNLVHKEYIHKNGTNPMPNLLKQLKEDIGNKGTVITWNMKFEKGCNKRMAKLYPYYKDFLEDLNKRIDDLMTPFYEFWYVDKDFHGSASIKYVLPALVPELTYDNMDISDGGDAQVLWMNAILRDKPGYNKEQIIENLLKYCELDTLAMVEIYNVLRSVI